jgi:endonuclease/exonuclease/phosphatase family metal-dependent hydrolase
MTRILLAFLLLLGPMGVLGRAAELKVTTWNMEWLTANPDTLPEDVHPKPAEGVAALRRYALLLDADVVAFEEVDGPAIAAQVFPPDRYQIFTTADHVTQRVGFAVRRGIPVRQNPDLAALDVQPNARFRLRSGADITLDLPSGPLRLLAVHLKTGCHYDVLASHRPACRTLREQVPPLQGWIAQRRADGVPFVVLGDFNREMDGHDDLLAALQEAAPLARATEGQASPCWGGTSFIDHILAGGAAKGWMEPGTLRVLVYRERDEASRTLLSDHCPVSVRFRLPGDAAIVRASPTRETP